MSGEQIPQTAKGREWLDAITDPKGDPIIIAAYARHWIGAIEAEARADAEARVRVLREAAKLVDEGWHSEQEGAWVRMRYASDLPSRLNTLRAALLAEPPAAAEPSRLVAEWLTVERLVIALHRLAPPTHFVGSGINTHICLGAAGHIETATALRDALLREGGAS